MLRRSLSLGAAVLVTLAGPKPVSAQLANPGFETGALNPWHEDKDQCDRRFTCVPWAVTSADAHTGVFSAEATGNQELRQDFATPFAPGSIGSVTYWARYPNATFPGFVFDFYYVPFAPGVENRAEFFVRLAGTGWQFVDATPFIDPTQPLTGFAVWAGDPDITLRVDDFTIGPASPVTSTPEPASVALVALGLAGLGGLALRRRLVG